MEIRDGLALGDKCGNAVASGKSALQATIKLSNAYMIEGGRLMKSKRKKINEELEEKADRGLEARSPIASCVRLFAPN